MGWSPESLAAVRGGLYDVIQSPEGTGRNAAVAGVEMAGKTGTAEFGIKEGGLRHVWMTIFAPFTSPRYAVAMVLEEGESGGLTVAPRIRRLMEGVFELERRRAAGEDGA